jgi:SPOR domain
MELTMKMLRGLCLLAVLALAACGSAQGDWQQASATNTLAAYAAFAQKHPDTPQAVEAHNRIHGLRDEQAWARAEQVTTIQAYQNYIQDDAAGIHVDEAKDHIASGERAAAWTAASSTDTPDVLEAFLQKYPQGPQADQAKARLAQLSGYRVQLASFHSEKQAQKTRDRLQGKYGDVLGSVDIVPGTTADMHVLRSASMGQGEANNACAKLKRDHLPCEVIKDANS